jgi:hypothetical protein
MLSLCELLRPVGDISGGWAKVFAGTRKELAARLAIKSAREEISMV